MIEIPSNAASNTTTVVDAFGDRVTDDFGQVDEACLTSDINDLDGVSADPYGQHTKDFSTLATVWSKVVDGSGSEGEQSDQIVAVRKVSFIIRYRTDFDETARIVFDGDTYTIESLQRADSRKSFLKIQTRLSDG